MFYLLDTDWINNPNLTKFAKDLLNAVIYFCKDSTTDDFATLSNIMKMKLKVLQLYFSYLFSSNNNLKTKAPNQNIIHEILPQLLHNNPEYPPKAFSVFLTSEILPNLAATNAKLINSKLLLQIMKNFGPYSSPEETLANVVQDYISNDSLRSSLRLFLRRFVKACSKCFWFFKYLR